MSVNALVKEIGIGAARLNPGEPANFLRPAGPSSAE
jgi:hypothetical protein